MTTIYQIVLVDDTTFYIVVILALLTAVAFREAMDGATLTAMAFFPLFIFAGLVAEWAFLRLKFFVSGDPNVNTVFSSICGIAVMLLILLLLKRFTIALADAIHRRT